jgi:hypothetical protein
MEMFFPFKSLYRIVCHLFQTMSNINKCTISIQNIKNILERKATWDEPIEKAQPQSPNSK